MCRRKAFSCLAWLPDGRPVLFYGNGGSMQYRALYRETRPEIFSEILGQDHIVRILRHQIASDRVSHAYLFCGTRGTGKTTTARILAKAVNCTGAEPDNRPCGECANCRAIAEGRFLDVIEIDAASNNGVDNIRELRESVNYPPAVGRKKVYIIDEVHMLSTEAFNALLKTLEEPPENVIFILATTNPEKLPQTVLSRCMRLDFRRVPARVLSEHMEAICRARGVTITKDALGILAANADGSVRDSLSILEQCLSSGAKVLERDTVLDFLGTVSEEFFTELTDAVMANDVSGAFMLLDGAVREGKDVRQLMKDWMAHLRALLIVKYVADPSDMLNMSLDNIENLKRQAAGLDISVINKAIVTLASAINDARYSTQARILMEVAIVTIASGGAYGQAPVPSYKTAGAPGIRLAPEQQVNRPVQQPAGQGFAASEQPAKQPVGRGFAAPEQPAKQPVQAEQPAEEKPRKAAPGSKPINAPEELAEVWGEVLDEAERVSPVLNVLRRATLAEVGETEFKVIAAGVIDRKLMESQRRTIQEIMSRHMGRELSLSAKAPGEDEVQTSIEDIRAKAEELLGTKIKIKK